MRPRTPWGIKVNRVELKNIIPPREIQDAMERQMKAGAGAPGDPASVQAEGQKQSKILVAEGERQSVILRAQAAKEAKIMEAEAQAAAILKVKEAEAEGLRLLTAAAPQPRGHPAQEPGGLRRRRRWQGHQDYHSQRDQSLAGLAEGVLQAVKPVESAPKTEPPRLRPPR